jgi:hypothetical protein
MALEPQLTGALLVALVLAKQENMPPRLMDRLVNLTQTHLSDDMALVPSIRFTQCRSRILQQTWV